MLLVLEAGTICSEHTFDGDCCHYVALNLRVRRLLKAFEARPPPLGPLPATLRHMFLSCPANCLAYLEHHRMESVIGWKHTNVEAIDRDEQAKRAKSSSCRR
ncbi:BTB/POZ domain-containing protein [Platanthera zijinensis]|uniref:BTB/POZ domain-containing protein n=1 Tax=Platanthera zijinensis TaxID=2320716 RepID=A0AAP0BJF0_9ASPA